MSRVMPSAAILVGGYARRFGGVDKSRLIVGGRSIIVRQLAVLQRLADDIFVVGRDPDRFADLGLRGVTDAVDGAGALGGIYTAVTAAIGDPVIVVGCDLPFLDASVLGALVELAAGRDGAWVGSARGVEPLVACYARATAPRMRARLDAREFTAAGLAETLDMAELSGAPLEAYGDPERLLTNVNTPADVARIESMLL